VDLPVVPIVQIIPVDKLEIQTTVVPILVIEQDRLSLKKVNVNPAQLASNQITQVITAHQAQQAVLQLAKLDISNQEEAAKSAKTTILQIAIRHNVFTHVAQFNIS